MKRNLCLQLKQAQISLTTPEMEFCCIWMFLKWYIIVKEEREKVTSVMVINVYTFCVYWCNSSFCIISCCKSILWKAIWNRLFSILWDSSELYKVYKHVRDELFLIHDIWWLYCALNSSIVRNCRLYEKPHTIFSSGFLHSHHC